MEDASDGPVDYLLEVRNGVLVYTADGRHPEPDATARSTKAALAEALFGGRPLDDLVAASVVAVDGDVDMVGRIFGLLDDFPLWFEIIRP